MNSLHEINEFDVNYQKHTSTRAGRCRGVIQAVAFIINPFHFRIAMMAQAVIPCNLLLACRVQVVDDSTVPLLAEMRCGSYGVIQAGP